MMKCFNLDSSIINIEGKSQNISMICWNLHFYIFVQHHGNTALFKTGLLNRKWNHLSKFLLQRKSKNRRRDRKEGVSRGHYICLTSTLYWEDTWHIIDAILLLRYCFQPYLYSGAALIYFPIISWWRHYCTV